MRTWILLFFSFLIFLSCDNAIEKPKNLISKEKMANVLTEIYMRQQGTYLSEIGINKSNFAKIDAQIIKKFDLTPHDFKESYRFYVLNPDEYREILVMVQENLENKLPEKERQLRRQEKIKKNSEIKKK